MGLRRTSSSAGAVLQPKVRWLPREHAVDSHHASRGNPAYIRSDNGLEFVAKAMRDWITAVGTKYALL